MSKYIDAELKKKRIRDFYYRLEQAFGTIAEVSANVVVFILIALVILNVIGLLAALLMKLIRYIGG
jgi:hypothetical protein